MMLNISRYNWNIELKAKPKCFSAAWSSYIKDDQIIEQSHMVNICKYLEVTLSEVKLFIFVKSY